MSRRRVGFSGPAIFSHAFKRRNGYSSGEDAMRSR
jgi:AraC-like DNA-binding protein